MGFFDEINNLFNEGEIDKSFKIVCYGKSAVEILGFKSIFNIDKSEICLLLKNGDKILISGANLEIKKIEEANMVIAGKVLNISFN